MQEYKNIILVSHCLLNELSVNNNPEIKDNFSLIKNLMKMNVGIFQLPCPEDEKQTPSSNEDFDGENGDCFCVNKSRAILKPIVDEICDYIKDGVNFLGVIGIDGSSSCSVGQNFKYENSSGDFSLMRDIAHCVDSTKNTDSGIFMEQLKKLFDEQNIHADFYGYHNTNTDEIIEKINRSLVFWHIIHFEWVVCFLFLKKSQRQISTFYCHKLHTRKNVI